MIYNVSQNEKCTFSALQGWYSRYLVNVLFAYDNDETFMLDESDFFGWLSFV